MTLYKFLTDIGAWPLRVFLRLRAWRGKEEPTRLAERRGLTEHPRPDGCLIWCHAASVGESLALLSLINRFCSSPQTYVVMTTGTVSSARVMADRLPSGAVHQYAPWDRCGWVAHFLDHWRPNLAVRMESELWPNTLRVLDERKIPTAMVNGRLSDRSLSGWARFPSTAQSVFECVDLVLAQSDAFADAFRRLGARNVNVTANLKVSADPLPVSVADFDVLRNNLGARPVWLAASTHDGEERIAIDIHCALAADIPGLLTIIVPRHPHRGSEITQLAADRGVTASQRSAGGIVQTDTDVFIADTIGELGLFFRLSPVVFMGKSLSATGGQNPIEPAHFDCAILFGSHMENFEDIAETMISEGVALQVANGEMLENEIRSLLRDEARRSALSTAADALIQRGAEGLEKTHTALQTLLSETTHHGL